MDDAIVRRPLLWLSAFVALSLAVLPGNAAAQQKSLKELLVGAWTLVALDRIERDGTTVKTYGEDPRGIAHFGADGRFFVLFARGDLPRIASNDRAKATADEARALVDGTIAYAGTYTVDEASKTLAMRIEVGTFPNQAPTQTRIVTSLTATELKFINPTTSTGARIEATMKRAAAAAN